MQVLQTLFLFTRFKSFITTFINFSHDFAAATRTWHHGRAMCWWWGAWPLRSAAEVKFEWREFDHNWWCLSLLRYGQIKLLFGRVSSVFPHCIFRSFALTTPQKIKSTQAVYERVVASWLAATHHFGEAIRPFSLTRRPQRDGRLLHEEIYCTKSHPFPHTCFAVTGIQLQKEMSIHLNWKWVALGFMFTCFGLLHTFSADFPWHVNFPWHILAQWEGRRKLNNFVWSVASLWTMQSVFPNKSNYWDITLNNEKKKERKKSSHIL